MSTSYLYVGGSFPALFRTKVLVASIIPVLLLKYHHPGIYLVLTLWRHSTLASCFLLKFFGIYSFLGPGNLLSCFPQGSYFKWNIIPNIRFGGRWLYMPIQTAILSTSSRKSFLEYQHYIILPFKVLQCCFIGLTIKSKVSYLGKWTEQLRAWPQGCKWSDSVSKYDFLTIWLLASYYLATVSSFVKWG